MVLAIVGEWALQVGSGNSRIIVLRQYYTDTDKTPAFGIITIVLLLLLILVLLLGYVCVSMCAYLYYEVISIVFVLFLVYCTLRDTAVMYPFDCIIP